MLKKNIFLSLGLCIVLSGLLLSGCSGSASISYKNGPVTATGTVQYDHTCTTEASCRNHGGVFMKVAQAIEHFFINEAMAGTTIFDASTGRLDISTTNVTLTTNTGTATVTLFNNGVSVASKTVGFYRSGNSLYVSNPANVNSWVSTYQGRFDTFTFVVNGLQYQPTTTADTTASVTTSMYYDGALQAVATKSYPINHYTKICTSVGTCTQQK